MSRLKFFLPLILSASVALPASAASGRYAIRSESVVQAMTVMGIQVSASQLTMLTDAVATTADPQLRVQSVQRWQGSRVLVRLECAIEGQCLPFYVGVQFGDAGAAQVAAMTLPVAAPRGTRAVSTMAVRAGSPATLFLDGDHVHIRIAVTCMESGSVGQTIRVSGPDHQRIYRARIVGAGMLKGTL